jgi:hypothetical protein
MTINRHEVESSNIASIGYDPETQTLEIEFKRGGVYQYSDVPADVWEAFQAAESKGKFFHAEIKKGGGYEYTKVS